MIKILPILLLAATCNAQHIDRERDVFIDHEGNVGRNVFAGPSKSELDQQMGEDAWQFLVPAHQKMLERYAENCYRDFQGEIWTTWFSEQIKTRDEEKLGPQPLWWFNLNRQFGGDQYRPVADDDEPISAKELLGALINSDVKMVKFVRDRRQTRGAVYERRLSNINGRKPTPSVSGIGRRGRVDNQRFWIYRNVRVDGPEYETIWTFREQRFPTERIERQVCRWRENEENTTNDESLDTDISAMASRASRPSDDGESGEVRDNGSQRAGER